MTADSGAASLVGDFLLLNSDNLNGMAGVREVGSSLSRYHNLTYCVASDNSEYVCAQNCANLDASGQVQIYIDKYQNQDVYYMGHFDYSVGYTELFNEEGISNTDTWEDEDLSDILSGNEGVWVEMSHHHLSSAVEPVGMRINASDQERRLDISPRLTSQARGFTLITGTDSDGIIELYNGYVTSERPTTCGYFEFGLEPPPPTLGVTYRLKFQS